MKPSTKACLQCQEVLPVEAFSRNMRRTDGLQIWCKKCQAQYNRDRIANNIEFRERKNLTSIRWAKANPERLKEYRVNNPEKIRARKAVNYLVESGKIPRPTDCQCASCGEPAAEYHHHRGYAMEHRHDVVPVCYTCHGRSHAIHQQ